MPGEPLSRFEMASARLRALGLTLRARPGEFVVNFRNGGDATAYVATELDEAVAVGEAMAAAERPLDLREGHRHSLSSAKRCRRRFIRRHNNWFRRRSLRRERGD